MENVRQSPIAYTYKRQVFFLNLSPETTDSSLRAYLGEYQLESCRVVRSSPSGGEDHGVASFLQESDVDILMAARPHRIDNVVVEIYRSVPGQGSMRAKKGVTTLIVFDVPHDSLTDLDLREHFEPYGQIIDINWQHDQNSWAVVFKDYDFVDRAILQRPHTIGELPVSVKKRSRFMHRPRNTDEGRPFSRRTIKPVDTQSAKGTYSIHVNNLPSNVTAENVSQTLGHPILDIVMFAPSSNPNSPLECWLKGIETEEEAQDFLECWDGQLDFGRKIKCEIEEEQLELCPYFRLGTCQYDQDCLWDHVSCTAEMNCSQNCPYGHEKGVKIGFDNEGKGSYRIKVTGFPAHFTPEMLCKTLKYADVAKCRLDNRRPQTAHLIHIKPYKVARHLLSQWQSDTSNESTLLYQFELYAHRPFSDRRSNSQSRVNNDDEDNGYRRPPRSVSQRPDHGTRSRDDSSDFRETSTRKLSDAQRPSRRFDESNTHQLKPRDHPSKPILRKSPVSYKYDTGSSANRASPARATREFEGQSSERHVSMKASRTDPRQKRLLIEYDQKHQLNCRIELKALHRLKDVVGVVQVCPEEERSYERTELSIVTECPAGYSLEEFILSAYHGELDLFQAIQLVQLLTEIVEQVHEKGILHRNLAPSDIFIAWDFWATHIDQARLALLNFSQAYIRDDADPLEPPSIEPRWYSAPQSQTDSYEYTSTVDASNICAILLWLLTKMKPSDIIDILPHREKHVLDRLEQKITAAVRSARSRGTSTIENQQLRSYLLDTFNMAFGYPDYQPWTISDLACRLESIHELLSPRNIELVAPNDIFQNLVSTHTDAAPVEDNPSDGDWDLSQIASRVFQRGKTAFLARYNDQCHEYSWSDVGYKWLDSTQAPRNEYRHDDILTYYYRDRYTSTSYSVIITCLAVFVKHENHIYLSIASPSNGVMCRVPVGYLENSDHDLGEKARAFVVELNNLLICISKQRQAALSH